MFPAEGIGKDLGRKRRDLGRKYAEYVLIIIESAPDVSTLKGKETKYKRKDLRIVPELMNEPVDKLGLLREKGKSDGRRGAKSGERAGA